MTTIDILPCVLEDGNVRRPYQDERTQFYGAYQKDADGLSTHIVDFYCMDAGPEFPNDRYSAAFFTSVSFKEGDNTIPYMAMNSLGMYYHGEIQRDYLNAVMEGVHSDIDRIVPYESLPDLVRYKIRSECLGYIDQPITA